MESKRYMTVLFLLVFVAGIVYADTRTSMQDCLPLQNAISRMAKTLQVTPDAIQVATCEEVQWPDTALGVHRTGSVYLQVITPGYRIILEGGNRRYEYHTDMARRIVLANITQLQSDDAENGCITPDTINRCKDDLARRLGTDGAAIEIAACRPNVFPNAALGLPRPGEAYAQISTPGCFLVLTYDRHAYLYATTDTIFRYGGPLDCWLYSALYLEEIPNEPNLNGNLMQVSLAGTNPSLLIAGVNDYYPQNNGAVLAKRRISRSGHELLYLPPGQRENAAVVQRAFDFTAAVINSDGTRWAAAKRPMVGMAWEFVWGSIEGDTRQVRSIALPTSAKLLKTYWHLPNPVVAMAGENGKEFYELDLSAASPTWVAKQSFFAPDTEQWLLNKSETLVVKTEEIGGKPVTLIIREWFTGSQNQVARIDGLQMHEVAVSPAHGYVLISGRKDGGIEGIAVSLWNGEILQTVNESYGPVRLLLAQPLTWSWDDIISKTDG